MALSRRGRALRKNKMEDILQLSNLHTGGQNNLVHNNCLVQSSGHGRNAIDIIYTLRVYRFNSYPIVIDYACAYHIPREI